MSTLARLNKTGTSNIELLIAFDISRRIGLMDFPSRFIDARFEYTHIFKYFGGVIAGVVGRQVDVGSGRVWRRA